MLKNNNYIIEKRNIYEKYISIICKLSIIFLFIKYTIVPNSNYKITICTNYI